MDPILIYCTETTKFLLPLVIKEGYTYKDIQQHLVGAYIADIELPQYDQCVIVIFNEDVKPNCLLDTYIDNIVLYNKELEVYEYSFIYKIEDEQLADYISFISGKYSELTDITKQKILKFWQADKDTILHSVLYRSKLKIDEFIKKHSIKNNPQKNLYELIISKYRSGKELYRQPNFKKEMYGYTEEV